MSTKQEEQRELWRNRIAGQKGSGHSIRAFCREQGLKEPTFYAWRHRLRTDAQPVRFALVATSYASSGLTTLPCTSVSRK